MKKYISTILVSATFFLLSAQSASAGAPFLLFYNCTRSPCPEATAIFANLDLDKASYAPNEQVTLFADISSDDNPQPPVGGISPIAKGKIPPQISMGSDIFPELYTPQQMRDGILRSVALGNAPATPGTYQATVFAGAGGYASVGTKTIDFIVAAPVPSVSVYFSYLKEKVKAFVL